ncbi:hypothetical protein NDN01_07145 [Sphingomonas sp. QA11]|uniref:hypothetical protein n=1 Tax=Sphingomonas sp. QA11 TaxID=2950605 RepID=UPI00234B3AE9|nr:hypothetical protein [Sphingomonas sp. QA11]WCM28679.1 hypothetical protein NDN01_07145 [Sphingomonas sp. QA11]
MMTKVMPKIRASDLQTKRIRSPDGQIIAVKVVQSDSDTLEADFLAAFRSNVRRIRDERRDRTVDAAVTPEG